MQNVSDCNVVRKTRYACRCDGVNAIGIMIGVMDKGYFHARKRW